MNSSQWLPLKISQQTIEWEKVGFVPSFSTAKRVYLAGKLGAIKKIAHTRFSSQHTGCLEKNAQ